MQGTAEADGSTNVVAMRLTGCHARSHTRHQEAVSIRAIRAANGDMARHECEMLAFQHAKSRINDSETTRGMLKQIDGEQLSLSDGYCGWD